MQRAFHHFDGFCTLYDLFFQVLYPLRLHYFYMPVPPPPEGKPKQNCHSKHADRCGAAITVKVNIFVLFCQHGIPCFVRETSGFSGLAHAGGALTERAFPSAGTRRLRTRKRAGWLHTVGAPWLSNISGCLINGSRARVLRSRAGRRSPRDVRRGGCIARPDCRRGFPRAGRLRPGPRRPRRRRRA